MKKLLLSIAVTLIAAVSFAQEREDSLFEKYFTYENFKALTKNMDGNADDKTLQELVNKSDKEDLPEEEAKSVALKIVSLNARMGARYTELSRQRHSVNKNPAFDKMVRDYFLQVERTFKEPPLLAMMNPVNKAKLATISKTSFFDLLDWLANFQGCNVICCDKADYPHFNVLLWGGSYPNSVSMMKKAEPGIWRDNLICGFNLYNFPITYPINKAIIRLLPIINFVLGILNGTGPAPAFKDDGVFISRIPVLILRGFNINEPCKDTESWLLNNRIKAKH